MTPKAWTNKRKRELNFITIKNFCAAKDIVNRVKSKPTEWAENYILANHITDRLIFRMCEEVKT